MELQQEILDKLISDVGSSDLSKDSYGCFNNARSSELAREVLNRVALTDRLNSLKKKEGFSTKVDKHPLSSSMVMYLSLSKDLKLLQSMESSRYRDALISDISYLLDHPICFTEALNQYNQELSVANQKITELEDMIETSTVIGKDPHVHLLETQIENLSNSLSESEDEVSALKDALVHLKAAVRRLSRKSFVHKMLLKELDV